MIFGIPEGIQYFLRWSPWEYDDLQLILEADDHKMQQKQGDNKQLNIIYFIVL